MLDRKLDKKYYMSEAIREAYSGIVENDGGPFGCVIVFNGSIVGRGHDEVLKNDDCTCHGEIMAIKDACKNLGTFDLSGCELYTTAQPCPMCSGAIQWARISKVYQGCNYEDIADIGFDDKKFFENNIQTEEVDRESCLKLFKDYTELNHTLY